MYLSNIGFFSTHDQYCSVIVNVEDFLFLEEYSALFPGKKQKGLRYTRGMEKCGSKSFWILPHSSRALILKTD